MLLKTPDHAPRKRRADRSARPCDGNSRQRHLLQTLMLEQIWAVTSRTQDTHTIREKVATACVCTANRALLSVEKPYKETPRRGAG